MKLEPEHPPGRATRKARAFSTEIARLTSDGYNSEAIRKALAKVGVHVSRATVRREMTRPPGPLAREPTPDPITHPAPATVQPKPSVNRIDNTSPPGKDIAETFFKDVIDNAFVKGRTPS